MRQDYKLDFVYLLGRLETRFRFIQLSVDQEFPAHGFPLDGQPRQQDTSRITLFDAGELSHLPNIHPSPSACTNATTEIDVLIRLS
jgi:hypothetical protein